MSSARFWKDCIALELKLSLTHAFVSLAILLSDLFPAHPFYSSGKALEKPTSFVSTASSSGESFAYNTWNPLLELLFHEHISSILVLSVDEFDLAKIALSCQFALDLLCYDEGVHNSE